MHNPVPHTYKRAIAALECIIIYKHMLINNYIKYHVIFITSFLWWSSCTVECAALRRLLWSGDKINVLQKDIIVWDLSGRTSSGTVEWIYGVCGSALPLLRLIYLQMTILNYSGDQKPDSDVNQICLNNNAEPPPRQPRNIIEKLRSLSLCSAQHLQTHLNLFLVRCCLVQQRSLCMESCLHWSPWKALGGCPLELPRMHGRSSAGSFHYWSCHQPGLQDHWSLLVLGHLTHVLFSRMFDWTWLAFDFRGAVYYWSIKWRILL